MAFEITSRSLRRTQWSARAPRLAVMAACVVLCAIGARSLIGRPAQPQEIPAPSVSQDLRAQAFAEGFARAYLTWDPRHPATRIAALRRYAPALADAERDGSLTAPAVRQIVRWSSVADDQPDISGRRITVVAETNQGTTAVAVTVKTDRQGGVAVTGYPAIVGSPPLTDQPEIPSGDPVDDSELGTTVTRALRNYLQRRRDDLAADLLPGAVVVVPDASLRLASIEEMTWRSRGRVVSTVLRAGLHQGGEVRLGYELGVTRQAGRWFVSWIGSQQTTTSGSSR